MFKSNKMHMILSFPLIQAGNVYILHVGICTGLIFCTFRETLQILANARASEGCKT